MQQAEVAFLDSVTLAQSAAKIVTASVNGHFMVEDTRFLHNEDLEKATWKRADRATWVVLSFANETPSMPQMLSQQLQARANDKPPDFFQMVENGFNIVTEGASREWLTSKRSQFITTASDFCAGVGDTVSGGLTARLRQWGGYDDVVDYSSTAYVVGGYVGQAINIGLMVGNPVGWAAMSTRVVSLLNVGFQMSDAVAAANKGDWTTAGMLGFTAILSLIPGAGTPCKTMSTFGKIAPALGRVAAFTQRIVTAVSVVQGTIGGVSKIIEGDIIGGLLELGGAAASARRMMQSCFAAGTPLLTPTGHKSVELFQRDDELLSRSEFDPEGPLEAKRVEEVFVRTGRIWHLTAGGQLIRTTPEHPFWVVGKGWVETSRLQVGDVLGSHNGKSVAVQALEDTGDYETVYNLRVADWHTYFVGGREWECGVWAHNEYDVRFRKWKRGDAIDKPMPDGSAPKWEVVQSRYWKNRYEAAKSTREFSKRNLDLMKKGSAPVDFNTRTQQWESRELHHVIPQRVETNNTPLNLRELTPDWHAEVDPSRRVPGIFPIRGTL